MLKRLKLLIETNKYRKKFNYFDIFSISLLDLEVVFSKLNENKDRMDEYLKEVEKNIDLLINKYSNEVKINFNDTQELALKRDKNFMNSYILGILIYSSRILIQEYMYIEENSYRDSDLFKFREGDKYSKELYQKSLLNFYSGMQYFIFKNMNDNIQIYYMLINLDKYIDKGIFNLKKYKDLLLWIWMWVILKQGVDISSFISANGNSSKKVFPNIRMNILEPIILEVKFQNDDKEYKSVFLNETYADEMTLDKIEENKNNIFDNIKINENLTMREYKMLINSIISSFTFFPGYKIDEYVKILINHINDSKRVNLDFNSVLFEIKNLTLSVEKLKKSLINSNFMLDIISFPILEFNNTGESIMVSFPEWLWMYKNNLINYSFAREEIKTKIDSEFKTSFSKLVNEELNQVFKKQSANFIRKNKENNYELVISKKHIEKIDYLFYDKFHKNLYIGFDNFLTQSIEFVSDYKNTIEFLDIEKNDFYQFAKKNVNMIIKNYKKIKKDFSVSNDSKLTIMIFTNENFDFTKTLIIDDYEIYIIDYKNIQYFFNRFINNKQFNQKRIVEHIGIEKDISFYLNKTSIMRKYNRINKKQNKGKQLND